MRLLVGAGKRAPHGFRCLWLVSPHGSLDRLKCFYALFPYMEYYKTDISALQGSARVAIAQGS